VRKKLDCTAHIPRRAGAGAKARAAHSMPTQRESQLLQNFQNLVPRGKDENSSSEEDEVASALLGLRGGFGTGATEKVLKASPASSLKRMRSVCDEDEDEPVDACNDILNVKRQVRQYTGMAHGSEDLLTACMHITNSLVRQECPSC
jgi:hypothetical protein